VQVRGDDMCDGQVDPRLRGLSDNAEEGGDSPAREGAGHRAERVCECECECESEPEPAEPEPRCEQLRDGGLQPLRERVDR